MMKLHGLDPEVRLTVIAGLGLALPQGSIAIAKSDVDLTACA